jgi:hypothetical protein
MAAEHFEHSHSTLEEEGEEKDSRRLRSIGMMFLRWSSARFPGTIIVLRSASVWVLSVIVSREAIA